MVGSATYRTHLPADVALTEYSRKFYDGTYKWDSEGFTDETGSGLIYGQTTAIFLTA